MADLLWNKEFALEQTAGDEELLAELLVLFKDSSASDFALLQQAVAAQDTEGVVRAAHSLKGASASLGIEVYGRWPWPWRPMPGRPRCAWPRNGWGKWRNCWP